MNRKTRSLMHLLGQSCSTAVRQFSNLDRPESDEAPTCVGFVVCTCSFAVSGKNDACHRYTLQLSTSCFGADLVKAMARRQHLNYLVGSLAGLGSGGEVTV